MIFPDTPIALIQETLISLGNDECKCVRNFKKKPKNKYAELSLTENNLRGTNQSALGEPFEHILRECPPSTRNDTKLVIFRLYVDHFPRWVEMSGRRKSHATCYLNLFFLKKYTWAVQFWA